MPTREKPPRSTAALPAGSRVTSSRLVTPAGAALLDGEAPVRDDLAVAGLELARGHDRDSVAPATPAAQPSFVAPRPCAPDARAAPEVAAARAADGDVEGVEVAAAARASQLHIERDGLSGKGDLEARRGSAAGRDHARPPPRPARRHTRRARRRGLALARQPRAYIRPGRDSRREGV